MFNVDNEVGLNISKEGNILIGPYIIVKKWAWLIDDVC